MDDAAALGRRIRELRRRRGLSLDAAAGLAGISRAMLSYVERGERKLERRSHIEGIAYALQTSPSELLGMPYVATDPERATAQAHVDAIRDSLVGTEIGYAPTEPERPLPELVRRADDSCRALTLRGNYRDAAGTLAETIVGLHAYTVATPEQQERQALRALVVAGMTATCLTKELGYLDLAWIAAERTRQAAHRLGDPARSGVAALQVGYALESHRKDKMNTERALASIEPHVGGDLGAMQVYGMLHLRAAYCSAVYGAAADVDAHLREAEALAARTGDRTDFNLYFGPTNVAIWQVVIAVEQGEGGRVSRITDHTDINAMPSIWRQAMFHTELGRALTQARRDEAATEAFLSGEKLAPVYVRNNPYAREAVLDIRDRTRRTPTSRRLSGLVHRMGLT